MTLKIIGMALCPFCSNPTKVGISRDGEGRARLAGASGCSCSLPLRRAWLTQPAQPRSRSPARRTAAPAR